MENRNAPPDEYGEALLPPKKLSWRRKDNYLLHAVLFLLTLASTSFAGIGFVVPEAAALDPDFNLLELWYLGLPFGLLVIFFLTAHEFGHYFAARAHGVDTTLPYYIPMLPELSFFGTLGAVIRVRAGVPDRRALFDIGVAGPLAGFVVAFIYLVIGMVTVPGVESLYRFHPGYATLSTIPTYGLTFGSFPLFEGLQALLVGGDRFFPPMNEIYHYPFLAAGWFGMFVTMLNLIPAGQLDGGHILYAMFGQRQHVISRWIVRALIVIGVGSLGPMVLDLTRAYNSSEIYRAIASVLGPPLEWIEQHASWWFKGWFGWLFWAMVIRIFMKTAHPPTPDETPLDRKRMAIGWLAILIFALTFSYTGIFDGPGGPGEMPTPKNAAPQEPGEEV